MVFVVDIQSSRRGICRGGSRRVRNRVERDWFLKVTSRRCLDRFVVVVWSSSVVAVMVVVVEALVVVVIVV